VPRTPIYYKSTRCDGTSLYGGTGAWSLPQRRDDGTYIPGAWREVSGELVPCANGLHGFVAKDLLTWFALDSAVWVLEPAPRTPRRKEYNKVLFQKARLSQLVGYVTPVTLIQWVVDGAERALSVCWSEVLAVTQHRSSRTEELHRLSLSAIEQADTVLTLIQTYRGQRAAEYFERVARLAHPIRAMAYTLAAPGQPKLYQATGHALRAVFDAAVCLTSHPIGGTAMPPMNRAALALAFTGNRVSTERTWQQEQLLWRIRMTPQPWQGELEPPNQARLERILHVGG
jgi:hypothetical protein